MAGSTAQKFEATWARCQRRIMARLLNALATRAGWLPAGAVTPRALPLADHPGRGGMGRPFDAGSGYSALSCQSSAMRTSATSSPPRDKPLALYVYAMNTSGESSPGRHRASVCVNHNAEQLVPGLPFGGVGAARIMAGPGSTPLATPSRCCTGPSEESCRLMYPPYTAEHGYIVRCSDGPPSLRPVGGG